MRFLCWITMSTNTHSEYLTLISFREQQWLRESLSILGYPYIGFHVLDLGTRSCTTPNDYENKLDCPVGVISSPEGNTRFVTTDAYVIRWDHNIHCFFTVLCYKSEDRWFDSSWCDWNFSLT